MDSNSSKQHARGEVDFEGRVAAWVRDGELDGRPIVLLAHGAGAPFTSPFMQAVAEGLVARGCCVVRFHFPYMERNARDRLRRPPDREPVLLGTLQRMLALLDTWDPTGATPRVLAGKSMGGRMMSMLLAREGGGAARGAVYLGYPLHAPNRPGRLRAEHLASVPVPQLFVSGSKDTLCDLALLRPVLAKIGPSARLHVVEGGDHSIATSRRQPLEGFDSWLDVVAAFIREVSNAERA